MAKFAGRFKFNKMLKKIIEYIKYKFERKINRIKYNQHVKKLNKIKEEVLNRPTSQVHEQLQNTTNIPVIIINFNQLFYLRKLVDFLIKVETKNIVIIDNNSTYLPLLAYYEEIAKTPNITLHRLTNNVGHMVFWQERAIFKKYSDGFFVVTDADIVPNFKLEKGYLKPMLDILMKHKEKTKVGFALDLESIPNSYILKDKVIAWENKFWQNEIEKDIFDTEIDTTFALYWPQTDVLLDNRTNFFFNALRLGGNYIAQHGGWYLDDKNLTDEQRYYIKTANTSTSWKLDEKGNLVGEYAEKY